MKSCCLNSKIQNKFINNPKDIHEQSTFIQLLPKDNGLIHRGKKVNSNI